MPDPLPSKREIQMLLTNPSFHAFVEVIGNEVVGFVSLSLVYRIRARTSAVIEDMAVSVKHRRKGVARMLLKSVITEASIRGCFEISLSSSSDAVNLYHNAGFKASGTSMALLI